VTSGRLLLLRSCVCGDRTVVTLGLLCYGLARPEAMRRPTIACDCMTSAIGDQGIDGRRSPAVRRCEWNYKSPVVEDERNRCRDDDVRAAS
jgi:hypothetical protein